MRNWLAMLAAAAIALTAPAALAQEATIIGADIGMNAMDFDAARNSFFNQSDVDGDFALSFGEMADEMLLGGVRVEPRALAAAGFQFAHPQLEPALRHTLGKNSR